jgi:hypothetical protein
VSPIIGLASNWKIRQVIGMRVGNEIVLNLIELIFIVIIFVFIFVNLGFDIKELVATFASTLPAMAL